MKGWSRMKCPFCGHDDSKVVDSRPTDEGTSIRRRRECLKCFKRFTTYETVERMPLMLVKRDGTRQPYDRQKLLGGLVKACEKRPVSLMQLEQIVDNVEQRVFSALESEVSSKTIGELVMEQLRSVDEVAYVCLPSVQGYQYFYGRAEHLAQGQVNSENQGSLCAGGRAEGSFSLHLTGQCGILILSERIQLGGYRLASDACDGRRRRWRRQDPDYEYRNRTEPDERRHADLVPGRSVRGRGERTGH